MSRSNPAAWPVLESAHRPTITSAEGLPASGGHRKDPPVDSQLPFRRVAIALAAVALVATACGGAAAANPTWTYAPAASPADTLVPTGAPAAETTEEPTASAAADVNIDLSEWKVAVPSTMTSSQINLVIKNDGTIEHELLVFKSDLAPSAYPKDAKGDIVEDGPGISLISDGENIAPGGTQSRALDLSQPGTYLFVCNIPGHFKEGMYQIVTVTAP